ncbi:NAD+ synthetase [Candidatus Vecturithrix granuli]|uniref:Glutamine-dependent NAD(+) synthetase n=1 Tax=Vecturithrix granuli TaxID=1499967 RepID=A0A081C8K0_VECG1|nr:NAD+ synthetase [Candidatus Vecturithrix granuli]
MRQVRIAMAQINTTVGDLEGNTAKILHAIQRAKQEDVDIVTFPELAITGYPPQDLLLKPQFLHDNRLALERIIAQTDGITAIVGFVDQEDDIYNAAAIIHHQTLLGVHHKNYLPNYGVFDENRYFQAGVTKHIYQIGDITFGVNICEDIWYPEGPTVIQTLSGADLILNLSASPYYVGKPEFRRRMISVRAADSVVVVAYNNLVGGQDRLIFDGGGVIVNQAGQTLAQGKLFEEDFVTADIDLDDVSIAKLNDPRHRKAVLQMKLDDASMCQRICAEPLPARRNRPVLTPTCSSQDRKAHEPALSPNMLRAKEIYAALTLGLRDYVRKNGFQKVVLGLSGGIDSAMVATIAADALGADNVVGVLMPGPYSSQGSLDDAHALVENLKIHHHVIPISPIYDAFVAQLSGAFEGRQPDVAEENIQARCRGTILMALSNKFGYLTLTTGNKSEVSVGYATLYGDMAGGLGVISDVPKTTVYALAEYRNLIAGFDLIPRNTIEKAPSAELRANQKDSDSLPEYSVLDEILRAYIEHDKSIDDMIALGYEPAMVKDVVRKVDKSEYKRQQAAPGLKVTCKAFGPDRRLPITNKYKG